MSQDSIPRLNARQAWAAAFVAATVLTLLLPTGHALREWLTERTFIRHGLPVQPRTPWRDFVLREVPVWYSWLLVSPLILWFSLRFPLEGRRRLRHLMVHAAAYVLVICTWQALVVSFQFLLPSRGGPDFGFGEVYLVSLAAYSPMSMIVYISVVAVQHALVYNQALQQRTLQAARLGSRLAHAQMDVLRTQLQPHFLFNTLNTVQSLMHTSVPAAQTTVLKLSELLRRSLHSGSSHEVPLREELDFLDEYVSIQKIRFADRLSVRFEIESGTEALLVPQLLLQPLVENAIRHGLQPRAEPGTVLVRSARKAGRLVLEVIDDGVGLEVIDDGVGLPPPASTPDGEGGIGLSNTRERLRQLYGEDHDFSIADHPPHGVCVRISIPLRAEDASVAEFVELSNADPYRHR